MAVADSGQEPQRLDGGGDASALLGRADAQLYNAKRQGRNRVITESVP